MNFFRKKAKIKSVNVKPGGSVLEIIVNQKPLSVYTKVSLEYKPLTAVVNCLPNGVYKINTVGGGVGSMKEVLAKQLFLSLNPEDKNTLKALYSGLTKTDIRRVQPKKAGGKKARARMQKSYR